MRIPLFILTLILLAGCQVGPQVIITGADGTITVPVEIADTPAERALGLMHRTTLEGGMLFVFPREEERAFWMRDTQIPLSIAYIDSNYSIVSIHDMQPYDETPVPSDGPAQYALEVNQGFFAAHNITAGDRVMIEGYP